MLVGINLLREGLDIPEVSLVAILDADKEGFLRSERSLIQTIGRAASTFMAPPSSMLIRLRNPCSVPLPKPVAGVRNRLLQSGTRHPPRGVTKKIKDIIDGVYDSATAQTELKAAQQQAAYDAMDEKQ